METDQIVLLIGNENKFESERVGRGAEQHVVQVFLVAADQLPQFLGQGQDDMKVGNG